MPPRMRPAIERFRAKIRPDPDTGCWLWTGGTHEFGYGVMGVGRRGQGTTKAHRWAFEHFVGPIPDGMFVCHRCDVPACVNPDHLFLGTHLDNVRDAISKDRHARGEVNGHAKLTADDVRAIRADRRIQRVVAAEYGVARTVVSRIRSGTRWGHLS